MIDDICDYFIIATTSEIRLEYLDCGLITSYCGQWFKSIVSTISYINM